jgi:hypothetical protein
VTARGVALLAVVVVPLVLAASSAAGAALDARRIVASWRAMRRRALHSTEARFSALLREPLIVSGTLGYLGPGSLERRVTSPYTETTTIRSESVRIEREGESPRTFGLKRVLELQGFVSAFAGLLAGDAAGSSKTLRSARRCGRMAARARAEGGARAAPDPQRGCERPRVGASVLRGARHARRRQRDFGRPHRRPAR